MYCLNLATNADFQQGCWRGCNKVAGQSLKCHWIQSNDVHVELVNSGQHFKLKTFGLRSSGVNCISLGGPARGKYCRNAGLKKMAFYNFPAEECLATYLE